MLNFKNIDIGIDVDGVLRDFVSGVCTAYNIETGNIAHPREIPTYQIFDYLGIKDKNSFVNKYAKTLFLNTDEMPNAYKVNELKNYGKVHIITSQNKGLEKITLDWLDQHDIYYDDIHFTWDKKQVDVDFMLDDYPENLYKMNKHVVKVCYDAPYNKNWKGWRVDDIGGYIDIIKYLTKEPNEI